MDVGSEIANSVQRSCRRVRNDSHVRILESLPGGSGWIELKPGGPNSEMVSFTRSPDPVDAVGDALQESSLDDSCKGRGWYADLIRLPPGHQPPLAFAEID